MSLTSFDLENVMKIAIVNYRVGNLYTIKNAFEKFGHNCFITDKHDEIKAADIIVLPGVGAFKEAMKQLNSSRLDELLKELAKTKPIIGICLGMQLLFERSFEGGESKGLGLIKGDVNRFDLDSDRFKVPHIGWSRIKIKKDGFLKTFEDDEMYFIHSYFATTTNKEDTLIEGFYGGQTFSAAVNKGNVYGFQFHPENSGERGLLMIGELIKKLK